MERDRDKALEKFVVNIIHRPEMVPEYAEKVTGHGKEEDIGRKALLTESTRLYSIPHAGSICIISWL